MGSPPLILGSSTHRCASSCSRVKHLAAAESFGLTTSNRAKSSFRHGVGVRLRTKLTGGTQTPFPPGYRSASVLSGAADQTVTASRHHGPTCVPRRRDPSRFDSLYDIWYTWPDEVRLPELKKLPAAFYQTPGGNEPVRDWLLGLDKGSPSHRRTRHCHRRVRLAAGDAALPRAGWRPSGGSVEDCREAHCAGDLRRSRRPHGVTARLREKTRKTPKPDLAIA